MAQQNKQHLLRVLYLLLQVAVNCEHKEKFLQGIMSIPEEYQAPLAEIVQHGMSQASNDSMD